MSKHENDKDDKTTAQTGGASHDDAPRTPVDSHSGDAHSPYAADSAALGGEAAPRDDATLRDSKTDRTSPAADVTTGTGATGATSSGASVSGSTVHGATGSKARPGGSATGTTTTHASPKAEAPLHGNSGGNGAGGNGASSKGKGRGLILALLIILLLVLLAALAWGAMKFMHQQRDIDALKQQVQNTSALKSQVQSSQQKTASLSNRIDSIDQDMDRVLKELAATQQTDAREWLYAEVEYLLRLANQRLQLERDVEGAQALLQSADQRLERADNPAFLPVRREIHSELAALDSVPDVDRSGIYLQLAAEAEQLSQLPLSQDTEALSAQVDDGSSYSGGWREQLARVGNQFKDLVTVRHHDKVLEALITPEQEGYLRQNVRLLLEQAQLAMLKGEPKVFRTSLERASELIKNYYKTDNDGVQKVLKRLNELAGKNIQPKLPDISASLTQLREVVSDRTGASVAGQQGGNEQGSNSARSAADSQRSVPSSPESDQPDQTSSPAAGGQNNGSANSSNSSEQNNAEQTGNAPSGESGQRTNEMSQPAPSEQNAEQAQGEDASEQEAQTL